ncbi:MAG: hypothetical protein AAGJ46_20905, partial [Planctomycetota bacterium]
ANVFARPEGDLAIGEATLRGVAVETIAGPGGGPPLFVATMPVTFETMQESLFALVRCDCEPDGFFLLTGGMGKAPPEEGGFWRLNGHMHELRDEAGAARMHRVELSGECPPEALDRVLGAMGWPDAELVFELVQEGLTLPEKDFRRWAAAEA